MYVERSYRRTVETGLTDFQVRVGESDLWISAEKRLIREAEALLRAAREALEAYLARHPAFGSSLEPVRLKPHAPALAREMARAARAAGVGPMAAVAGAVAEAVGRGLLPHSRQVIVENGGDVFLHCTQPRRIAIFAGPSPLSQRVGLEIEPQQMPVGVCTSSGTVGPSLSLGRADAAVMVARSAALADAAATAVGNLVNTVADIGKGLDAVRRTPGIKGAVIIKEDRLGAWGQLKLVPLYSAAMLPFKDDNPTRTFPFVVLALLAANIAVFAWQKTLPPQGQEVFIYTYASIPAVITGAGQLSFETEFPPFLTLFTSMFLHGNLLHIGGNMLFLWVFGNNIEDLLGHLRFIAFYLVCGLLAMGAHVLVNPASPAPTVGASGAISGVLGAYLLRYPKARVHTLMLPLPFVIRLPAFFVLGYWFLIQWLRGHEALAMGPQMGGTAWFAHIGGFVAGMLLIALLQPRPKRPPPPPPTRYHEYYYDDPGR